MTVSFSPYKRMKRGKYALQCTSKAYILRASTRVEGCHGGACTGTCQAGGDRIGGTHTPLNLLLDCVLRQMLFPEKRVCQEPVRDHPVVSIQHPDDKPYQFSTVSDGQSCVRCAYAPAQRGDAETNQQEVDQHS